MVSLARTRSVVELEAGAERVDAAHVVEIAADVEARVCWPPARCAPPRVNASSTRMVGASSAECDSESDQHTCMRVRENMRRPERPHVLHADVVVRVLGRIGALLEVVLADAEVVRRVAVAEVAEAQRLIERHGVVDVGVDAHVVARRAQAQRFRSRCRRNGERALMFGVSNELSPSTLKLNDAFCGTSVPLRSIM